MAKILCIGELLIDMIGQEQEGLKNSQTFDKRPGGAPANVAVAASRLGAEVELIASVGQDKFGKALKEKMQKENIETKNINQLEGRNTTLAFVSLDEDAEPEFSFYREADQYLTQEIPLDADKIHVGSLPLSNPESAENIIKSLDKFNGLVSFDPNLRKEIVNEEYLDKVWELIKKTDILFAAEEEIKELGGFEEIIKHVEEVIETKGAKGAKLTTSEKEKTVKPPKVKPIDTTGAGDALAGAYLAFRDQGRDKALQKAVAAAAASTTKKGAMSALPNKEELKEYLQNE
jgi:fructokinase